MKNARLIWNVKFSKTQLHDKYISGYIYIYRPIDYGVKNRPFRYIYDRSPTWVFWIEPCRWYSLQSTSSMDDRTLNFDKRGDEGIVASDSSWVGDNFILLGLCLLSTSKAAHVASLIWLEGWVLEAMKLFLDWSNLWIFSVICLL